MFISEVETEAIKAMSADQERRRRNSEAQEPRTKKKNLQPPFREDVLKSSRKPGRTPDLHQVRGGAQERERAFPEEEAEEKRMLWRSSLVVAVLCVGAMCSCVQADLMSGLIVHRDYGVKLCGREFIRAVIFTCGGSRWRRSADGDSGKLENKANST